MATTFSAIYKGPHGETADVPDPWLAALQYASHITSIGLGYAIVDHGDGHVTVNGDGVAPITFTNPKIDEKDDQPEA